MRSVPSIPGLVPGLTLALAACGQAYSGSLSPWEDPEGLLAPDVEVEHVSADSLDAVLTLRRDASEGRVGCLGPGPDREPLGSDRPLRPLRTARGRHVIRARLGQDVLGAADTVQFALMPDSTFADPVPDLLPAGMEDREPRPSTCSEVQFMDWTSRTISVEGVDGFDLIFTSEPKGRHLGATVALLVVLGVALTGAGG